MKARIDIRVEQELKDKFKQVCKSKAINSSELLRRFILEWLEQQEKEVKK